MSEINKTDAEWQTELSAEQYQICRKKGTESPFTGKYHDCKTAGIYRCVCCGEALFDAQDKFDSGTGWPSFVAPIDQEQVTEEVDNSLALSRTEALCHKCGAHLGHVFPDGPTPTGMRYCINSASLDLEEKA